MEAMLAPVDGPLLRALQLDKAYRIADIGCGGGATAVEAFHYAPAGSVVDGYDIAPTLIEMARLRLRPGERITFEAADMATAPPPGEPYDRLVSRFGTMFFADAPAAFANLRRWLKPGGRFSFAVWARPADNPWFASVRKVMAEVIDLPAGDPEAPGPFRYGDAERMLGLLRTAGFSELAARDWRGSLPIGGGLPAAEAAKFALTAFSSFKEQLEQAGETKFGEAQRLLTERYLKLEDVSSVRMEACVHIVTGMRTN